MKPTYRIAEISFGSCRWDGIFDFELGGKRFEVQRFGAEYSVEALERMIVKLRSQVDAFAISQLPSEVRFKDKTYVHRQTLEVMSIPSSVPLCNGDRVRELANINGLSQAIASGVIRPEQGIYYPLAILSMECVSLLAEKYEDHLYFGDLYALLGLPFTLQPTSPFVGLTKLGINLANLRELRSLAPRANSKFKETTRAQLLSILEDVRYVFSDPAVLLLFGKDISYLRGKDVILPYSHPQMEAEIAKANPASIINLFPEPYRSINPHLNHSVLDAALRLSNGVEAPLSLEAWQQLLSTETEVAQATKRYVLGSRPSTQVKLTRGLGRLVRQPTTKAPDFGFVIHCLSYEYLFKSPIVGPLLQYAPPKWNPMIEKNIARLPGIVYGKARGIISNKTGKETTGLIYALFATPKAMREEEPEKTYEKIERICYHAAEHGVKLMGLGAYTKIVGDAGATINRNSPIPVTTGNSLSASATLWALHQAVKKMRLLKFDPETGLVNGTVTVIGATGSIGRVSAKMLSMVFNRIVLVAPRIDRLADLKFEIEKLSPRTKVSITTDANEVAAQTDVLVTATSAFDQKIIDIERLKPGCVVCDCSRPLDFTLEDAMKRPDVLIIESGEVVLPGSKNQFTCDIGLPEDIVYACLGETVVLAMEGMYEPFTLGRDIEWNKVKRIYQLAVEHGVELAAIRGVSGFISDKEIELARTAALAKRKIG
ncbi:MAG: dehydrogenase [Bdellovibrionota bacterium]